MRRRWCPVGLKLVQAHQLRFEWCWLVLGVDLVQFKLRWRWQTNLRKESMLETIQAWKQHEHGMDAVIWDNAPSHKTKLIRAAIGADNGQVIFPPPYSPELNPVERIFEYLRDQIEGELYSTIAAKISRVEHVLQSLANDTVALRQLAGWDWICDAVHALPLLNPP